MCIRDSFNSTDDQLKAKDILQSKLGDDYMVALNLQSRSPQWLTAINARPMYLGLDLRGGVHFLLQIDMKAALDKALDCLLYTSPSPRDRTRSRMPSSA